MSQQQQYGYCGIFTHAWNNPPAPFNPDYRPFAKELSSATTAALESEGAYDNFTLKQRQDLNLWRDMYELLREPYETAYQKTLDFLA